MTSRSTPGSVRGSVTTPAIADAAAVSGLARNVRPPLPWRPSKLRLEVLTAYWPGDSWSPFILDRPEYQGAKVLIAGDNFGTGSSREHAPWALRSWGVRAILSTSFADIFRSNALKNGVLPIVVDPETHERLLDAVEADPTFELRVDLAEQGILLPDGSTLDFDVDPFSKMMLLAGTDEIGYVQAKEPEIAAWEAVHPPRVDTRLGTGAAG